MNSPEIVLSFNEILFYFTRAAVGVGVPYGLAEDFARSSIWIAISGLDPVKISLPALKSLDEDKSSIQAFQTDDISGTVLYSAENKQLSAIQAGFAICDCISLISNKSKKCHKFTIKNVDHPFLIAAAVGSNNSECWKISWKCSNGNPCSVLITQNGNWKTSWQGNNIPEQNSPSDVYIVSIENDLIDDINWKKQKTFFPKNRKKYLEEGIPIYCDWQKLYYYFSRVLVPSDEKSRNLGAGAGLIDRD